MALTFHPLTLCDREAMQAVTLPAGRRNCNYTFTNLVGWKFLFGTEVCVLENEVVLRYTFNGKRAYMVCTSEALSLKLIDALLDDSNGNLTLMGLEDSQVAQLSIFNSPRNATLSQREFSITSEPVRNQYDYIYRRTDLATLRGRHLNAKRNHIHRFRAEHPDFEYHPLTPEFFDECRRLTATWQEEKKQTPNQNDNKIEIIVTTDTFDVCVEKADRHVEGAFAIINQQFAEHLPEQYIYLNREEDMGIPGLRQAKLSYHPEILLTYNVVHITKND